jgi:N-acyl-D-amino-acid deacylase
MHVRRIEQTLVLALLAVVPQTLAAQQPVSTLIRNASVIDGRGTPARNVSVRITGDRISDVGDLTAMASDRVVDAQGLTLTPGLIDTHSHHDRGLFEDGDALAMLSQGVTTIVIGQDGGGSGLADLFARIDAQPVAVNVASYAGHGPLRRAVLGDDFRRAATAAEVERMESVLRKEMAAGALGLSTGLEYDPGIYSDPAEVLALARVAAEAGGRYISHIRSEDRYFWNALDELIAIGRTHDMPVQVSHMKLGMIDLWGQADSVIRVLDRARASGVDVTADVYPYTYWQSNLGVFYPERNFADSVETAFVLEHLSPADGIIINRFTAHPEYVGKTIAQIAEARGESAVSTMLHILAQPDGPDTGIVARGMHEDDVARLMQWEWTNVCSDGTSTGLHPRGFGSFARVLGPWVRDRRLFPLAEAVRRTSSLAAQNVGIAHRGVIAPGYFADLVLFDPAVIADRATFDDPQAVAVGISTVWVNGQVVYTNGAPTGASSGRVIRR